MVQPYIAYSAAVAVLPIPGAVLVEVLPSVVFYLSVVVEFLPVVAVEVLEQTPASGALEVHLDGKTHHQLELV